MFGGFRIGTAFVLCLALMSSAVVVLNMSEAVSAYTVRDPILIDGDDDFTLENGVTGGSGTEEDPYVIRGWEISASSVDGIRVSNSDAHFIITDCYIHSGRSSEPPPWFDGIYLTDCGNATVHNNTAAFNYRDIHIMRCPGVVVTNNTYPGDVSYPRGECGILVYDCPQARIVNNSIAEMYGIWCSSNDILVEGNTGVGGEYGIVVSGSNITVNDNHMTEPANMNGIRLEHCTETLVTNNTMTSPFYSLSCRSLTISGNNGILTLQSCDKVNITNNSGSLSLLSCTNVSLLRNEANTDGMVGCYFNQCENVTVSDCIAYSNLYGFRAVESTDLHVSGNTAYSNDYGISLDACTSSNVSANNFSDNGWGIHIVSTLNSIVSGNVALSCMHDGIRSELCEGVRIVGNNASFCGSGGIHCVSSSHASVADNSLHYNEVGVFIDSCLNLTLADNTASSCDSTGIYASFCEDLVVDNNSVCCSNDGIRIEGNSTNVLVTDNVVTFNDQDGIYLSSCANSTVAGNLAQSNFFGLSLYNCVNASVAGNSENSGQYGMIVSSCQNTTLSGNSASGNSWLGILIHNVSSGVTVVSNEVFDNGNGGLHGYGLYLVASGNSTVSHNNVSANYYGVSLENCSSTTVYRNRMVDNYIQGSDDRGEENSWDSGYPTGGNFWSDYDGIDSHCGPDQNIIGSDGIGDTPYEIDGNSTDRYPVMATGNTPPVAFFTVSPSEIYAGTQFLVNASLSSDLEDPIELLEVRWDWDDDGVWDTEWTTTKTASHLYSSGGFQTILLEVRDTTFRCGQATEEVWVVDDTPPVTSATLLGLAGEYGWFLSAVEIELISDDGSGVDFTYYRVDGSEWEDCTGPLMIEEDGMHYLEFYSVDIFGSIEEVRNTTVNIDTVSPDTVLAPLGQEGEAGWYASLVTVTIQASDDTSGVDSTRCRVNGEDWFEYTDQIELPDDGRHTIEFYSTDLAGNSGDIQAHEICIDCVPPVSALTCVGLLGNNGWYVSNVLLAIEVLDCSSGVEETVYCLNGEEWVDYVSTFSISVEGTWSIEISSIDVAGNIEDVVMNDVRIDYTVPLLTILTENGAVFRTETANISFECLDSCSGVEYVGYSLDDGAFVLSESETYIQISDLDNGNHKLLITVRDQAGNQIVEELTFLVDVPVDDEGASASEESIWPAFAVAAVIGTVVLVTAMLALRMRRRGIKP